MDTIEHSDGEVQTDSIPSLVDLKKAYQELASSYNDVRYELDQYKEAYNRLAEKCAQNKAVWKQLSEQETAPLINSSKRRINRGTTEPQTIGLKFNGYPNPATPMTWGSPTPRAPKISPRQAAIPTICHSLITQKRRTLSRVSRIWCWRGGWEGLLNLVTQNSKPCDGGDSTESEDEPRSSDHYSGALNEPVLHSRDSAFKIPMIKKKTDVCGHGHISQEGDSVARPVAIKGESHASSGGFGYHIFDQESLDLDDIGQKPQTPQKH
ncbi:hypothetical protein B9Z19DRAFT_1065588 [Tuber borchii]|uniref:Uncharacterized protein n=1 Tax=Tuber borchii TaxID=42251 RepID=A0A2T6ZQN2_TUBBO|nr:hypothetical protein B9Z19DRAFT_1065588 [Tuber borchii]